MQLVWTEKLVRASTHPAFSSTVKTKIGEGEYLFDIYPINHCVLNAPTHMKPKTALRYLEDKKEHLKSFGILGEIEA